jgi:2-carboxy-1,4-naphthoquinone phytyltransferase
MSPIVRMGTKRAAFFLQFFLVLFYAANAALLFTGYLPMACAAAAVASAPFAFQLATLVGRAHDKPDEVKGSKFVAIRWHIMYGMVLAAAISLPKAFGVPI